jgi:hypothetical protein
MEVAFCFLFGFTDCNACMFNAYMFKVSFFKFQFLDLFKSGKANSVESLPELLTSDSEGSYAGVGSPRELQSPDFTTGFLPDKIEVCFKKHCFLTFSFQISRHFTLSLPFTLYFETLSYWFMRT